MKKLILFLIFAFLAFSNITFAAMNPELKECLQRGYETSFDADSPHIEYCVFPNGEKCELTEFNNKICGTEFMTENYCVKENDFVWDKDKCCNGLIPTHLKYKGFFWKGIINQSKCEPIPGFFDRYLKYSLLFWLGAITITILAVILIYKKLKSR